MFQYHPTFSAQSRKCLLMTLIIATIGTMSKEWPPHRTTRTKPPAAELKTVIFKPKEMRNPSVPEDRMEFLRWECNMCTKWKRSPETTLADVYREFALHRPIHSSSLCTVVKVFKIQIPKSSAR